MSKFTNPKCPECGRVFDMWNDVDSAEWSAGHDCEPPEPDKPTSGFVYALNDYCQDYYKHYEGYPVEFEYEGKVYPFEYFIDYVPALGERK